MDIFTIIIVVLIGIVTVPLFLQDRQHKKRGWPQKPLDDPFNPERTAHATAIWQQQVNDIEYRREQDKVDQKVRQIAESMREQGYFPTTQDNPVPPSQQPDRKELLHHGPFAGKHSMVSPSVRRINLPANAPVKSQHRYERNDCANFVWKGRADGSYPRVQLIDLRDDEPCTVCGERASRSVDISDVARNVLFCSDHMTRVAP